MSMLMVANWKMNALPTGCLEPTSPFRSVDGVDVIVLPTFLDIAVCLQAGLVTGAQCGRDADAGAFTGDISMAMLSALGVRYVLCGHSERRRYHRETLADIELQVQSALAQNMTPILCVGEQEEDCAKKRTETVIRSQLPLSLDPRVIVAYEPVWAIGTGQTPSTAAIASVHALIRTCVSPTTRLLYGGSVNETNARDILALHDVDGALVGGSSLDPQAFASLVHLAAQCADA